MTANRITVIGAAVFVAGLPAFFGASLLLLSWLPPLVASTALYPLTTLFRALPIPIMALLTLFAALTALRYAFGQRDARRKASDAPVYFLGLTVLYTTFALTIPLFEIWFYEPAIYAPTAIALLIATHVRSVETPEPNGADGNAAESMGRRNGRAIVLASLAAAMCIGASIAYGRELLAGNTSDCARTYCSTELTMAILVVMAGASLVASGVILRGALRDGHVTQHGILAVVTAFACLALLTAPMVVFRLVPYYYFVPGFFYGLSALVLLISVSANPELTDVPQPLPELRPPPDMPI